MLCQFLLYSKVKQLHINIHLFFFGSPPTQITTDCSVEVPVLFSLITYLIYINVNVNSKILIYPYPLTFLWMSVSCFSKFVSLFLLCKLVHLYEYLHSTCNWYLKIFIFLFLTYFTRYDNFSVHVCCYQWHYFILCYG